MIQLIGFMIGAYIITRMVETVNNKETVGIVAFFSFITILVVIASIVGLLINGSNLSSLAGSIPGAN
jgi:uncharacterized membrane protein AbrB (regulator of aidB expression)